ncbi:MAG TPA: hypothetical protein VK569_02695 [Bacteroidota bacterium]|nr:hypothetical protein [Bacteroidota bacterium]
MTHATALFIASLLIAGGCASMSRQRLEDIKPNRVYHKTYPEVFDAVKMYSLKEGFRLDRYGEEAGRVIGHKNTTSSTEGKQMSSIAETAMMVVMNLKMRKVSGTETEILVNFSFENGHVVVSREEEAILLDCYGTFFDFMQESVGS